MFSLLLYSKGYLDCCLCWLWFASSRINDFTHEIFESCQGSSRSRSNPPRVCESYPGFSLFSMTFMGLFAPVKSQDQSVGAACLS